MGVESPHLTLYSAPGCCLCDTMKEQLDSLAGELRFSLEVVDIAVDPELEAQYRTAIPVLLVAGRRVAKLRITTEALRRAIRTSR